MAQPLRVLIVEDSEDDAELLVRDLRRGGYEPASRRVDSAEEMTAALDSDPWEIIIADHDLPRFSALAALRLLKERRLDIPFIIVSGVITDDLAVAGMKEGVHDYLMKDNLTRLVPVVERELREAEQRRDRRALEQEVREAREELQAQLAHASRLGVMGEMGSALAHELHQPIAAIVNYANGCIHRLGNGHGQEQGDELRETLQEITRQAMRASETIQRVRNFIKKRKPQRQMVDVASVVRDAAEIAGFKARQLGVHCALECDQPLPRVFGDPVLLTQVVLNLVLNAIEALWDSAPQNRTLNVTAASPHRSMVEITVADSGPGIPPEEQEKLFDQFFTTKEEGLGMGLSISLSIVNEHGGRLELASEPGSGTTFRVQLPAGETA